LTGNKIYRKILWHIDPLLGNDRETNNETTAVARQRPTRNNGSTVESCVFYVVHFEAVGLNGPSSTQLGSSVHVSTVE
jgi:hypothetical protein